MEQIFTNRGINLSDIPHYLNTTDSDILDPLLIKNMERGTKMLVNHIAQGDKVYIQIDSDCDGYTSSAVLINYLYTLFPSFVQNNITYKVHPGKEHGINLDFIPEDVKLVIIPDAGSEELEKHKTLAENGIDVLVIDHHEAAEESPYACIINNQICDYPTKSLSGVGMVYKVCSYIDSLLGKNNADEFLDLVAVGLIADMMDLRDFETRHLVKRGLKQINNSFLRGAIDRDAFHFNESGITPTSIAFYISPLINATIRVGTENEKLILFEALLDHKGCEFIPSTKRGCKGQMELRVEQACRNCTNIKRNQTKSRDESLNVINEIIENKNLLENQLLVVKVDSDVDRNLTGLMANQIGSKVQHPTIIVRPVEHEGEIWWEGSARNPSNSALQGDFRQLLLDSNLVEYAAGHASAFGCGIKDSNFIPFIEYTNNLLKDLEFTPTYYVDYIYNEWEIKGSDVLDIASLKDYWGQGVSEPLIAIENLKIPGDNVSLLGSTSSKHTLKIKLQNGVDLIKFKSSEEEFDKFYSPLGCVIVNIVGTCEQNVWNGNITPQIKIESYEIVGTQKYYF